MSFEDDSPWVTRSVRRVGDMDAKRGIRIDFLRDGDITLVIEVEPNVPVRNEEGKIVTVEFCNMSGGGGTSPKTRKALIALAEAIEADNKDRPR